MKVGDLVSHKTHKKTFPGLGLVTLVRGTDIAPMRHPDSLDPHHDQSMDYHVLWAAPLHMPHLQIHYSFHLSLEVEA